MKENQKGFTLVEVLLAVIALTLVGFAGWYVWQSKDGASSNNSTTNTDSKNSATTEEGTITGPPSYPSEGIPQDLQVCAVSIADSAKVFCDNVGQKQTKNECELGSPDQENCVSPPLVNFSIKVPAGEYYVYSIVKSKPDYKAYYNEFSKCGNSVDCPKEGHKQYINVKVAANATVKDIDPSDWYDY